MDVACVRNVTRGTILAQRAEVARSPVRRFLGLMGRSTWTATDGLLIRRCNAIHTCFMRMPIDVVLVGEGDTVVHVAPRQRTWRVGPIVWRARWVVELPEGTIATSGTRPGDSLVVESLRAQLDSAQEPQRPSP